MPAGRMLAMLLACGATARPSILAARPQDTLTFVAVSAGVSHTCGLTSRRLAYCWGDNGEGELGSGERSDSPFPVAVAGGLAFLAIDAGAEFTCGVVTSGEAYCWGRNSTGALGSAATPRSPVPVPVTGGLLFQAVAAGGDHACGIAEDGRAWCWGANDEGQLGTGDTVSSARPVPVAGVLRFRSIAAGGAHTCGVTVDSLAYCWGSNRRGQLGIDRHGNALGPQAVATARRWLTISAGGRHTCGLTADRHPVVFCWGDNFLDQSAGEEALSWKPTSALDAPLVVGVDAGWRHTCVVRQTENAVSCFGNDGDDQLGRDVRGPYTAVSAGGAHTCALRPDGTIMCWGRNASGQLGNGSLFREERPVRVAAPATRSP